MRLIKYKMVDQRFSDHRPVSASFMAEVEVFSHRKLQKALTLTDAELEDGEAMSDVEIDVSASGLRLGEVSFNTLSLSLSLSLSLHIYIQCGVDSVGASQIMGLGGWKDPCGTTQISNFKSI